MAKLEAVRNRLGHGIDTDDSTRTGMLLSPGGETFAGKMHDPGGQGGSRLAPSTLRQCNPGFPRALRREAVKGEGGQQADHAAWILPLNEHPAIGLRAGGGLVAPSLNPDDATLRDECGECPVQRRARQSQAA
jgi:hypothetical protein